MLTEIDGGLALVGVDLDTCRDPAAGDIAGWAREVVERFGSYAEVSPSATGLKVFALMRIEERDAIRAEIREVRGDPGVTGIKWARGGGEHPPAIEVFTGGRYFAVTGQRLDGAPGGLRVLGADTLRWLIREHGPAFAGNGHDREEGGARDNSRSGIAFRKGLTLVRGGAGYEAMCVALRADPETAEWVHEKGEAQRGRQLRRIFEKARAEGGGEKPAVKVQAGDLPATASAVRDLLAASDRLFDRGGLPVKLVDAPPGGLPMIVRLTPNSVVTEAHRRCQPFAWSDRKNKWVATTLPDRVAKLYLDMTGEWGLPALDGIATAPLLTPDGGIRAADGYDPATRLWCCNVPSLALPQRPTRDDAEAALLALRRAFRTFPAADAGTWHDPDLGVEVVDLETVPGRDESAILSAVLTAVCRPSLWLAPGFLATAPDVSGAGTGKGLLVRIICAIGFGVRPRSFTTGGDGAEMEKRIAAELVEAAPALFLDNVNAATLRSDLLASILTERPARVRLLGETRMVPLNSAAFVAVTGNGLTVSEDLVRRFLFCTLDARMEEPERRPFRPGFLEEIEKRRADMLGAALTIWRWGRQNAETLKRGKPLGSFEQWAEWVRDPLLTLGCADPVERLEEVKGNDPKRQRIAQLFSEWWLMHKDRPVKASELDGTLTAIIDPQERGRQYVAARLGQLAGTRAAGYVLSREKGEGTWSAATYALKGPEEAELPADWPGFGTL